ncbi:MAG TPA: VOC family protein [Polyangia bacterium]|nr:VOC family protein [Polyangia bacterium]
MTKSKSHIPEGLPAVIPQLVVKDGRALVDFAVQAFGAQPGHFMPGPDGKGIMHGMFTIGGAAIFVSDAAGFAQPTSANLFVYVPDVDASFAKAVQAGAKVIAPVSDMFWGDRWGMLADAWGNVWQVATNREQVSPEEMKRRMAAAQNARK